MEHKIVIIGAGPAGLTAAYVLTKRGVPSTVLESDTVVGGISRTATRRRLALRHRRPPLLHQGAAGRGPLVRDPRARRLPEAAAAQPHLLPRQVLRLPDLGDERAARTSGRSRRCAASVSYLWVRIHPPKDKSTLEGFVVVALRVAPVRPLLQDPEREGLGRARAPRSRPTGARSASRTSRCSARCGRR